MPTGDDRLEKLGYFQVVHKTQEVVFVEVIDGIRHWEIQKMIDHGPYAIVDGFRGDVGFRDSDLGDIVFKRDFVWRYPNEGKWSILGYFKKID